MFDALVARSLSAITTPELFISLSEQAYVRAALSRLSTNGRRAVGEGTLTYLSGPEGTGKSLVTRQAIREIRRRQPKYKFLITSAAELAEWLTTAEAQQGLAEVQEQFRGLNLLVCEELQALEGQEPEQELLRELMDGLRHQGTHILITSRKLPGELRDFSPRWVSRCHGGLCVKIPNLGRESRIQLIAQIAQVRNLPFSDPVAPSFEWLADRWNVSPSEIVSLLDRLEADSRRQPVVIDIPSLENWLAEETPLQVLSLDAIASVVASEFGIAKEELRSRSRQPGLIVPRQCAMYLAREMTDRPLEFIGHYFGERTHTTVSHSVSRLKALLPTAPTLRQQVQRLQARLAQREDCA